jgi:Ca2+-binding RTX toxin-like protein
MRSLRATLLLATMVLGVLTFGAVALAKDITGTNGRDDLRGSNKADTIRALGGPDHVLGMKGKDVLRGGNGRDMIQAVDRNADFINCGPGFDMVHIDAGLDRWENCEDVHRGHPGGGPGHPGGGPGHPGGHHGGPPL